MRAYTLLLPELDVGFVVLSNGSSNAARNAVMNTLKYAWLPVKQRDWIAAYVALDELDEAAQATREADESAADPRPPAPPRPLAQYAGRYRDAWFGEATVTVTDAGLAFAADKSPKLSGPLEHVDGDTFVARWPDRSVGMDAWLRFEFDRRGALQSLRMNRVFDEPDATVDYFEYLDFRPVD